MAAYRKDPRCSPCSADFKCGVALAQTIRLASLAICADGRRHAHQRRIPLAVLEQVNQALQARIADIAVVPNFHALHQLVVRQCGAIHGAAEMVFYDTALRIGACLSPPREPELVYLHAGARKGARQLGIRGRVLPLTEFLQPMHVLTPSEAEDFLCRFEPELATLLQI